MVHTVECWIDDFEVVGVMLDSGWVALDDYLQFD